MFDESNVGEDSPVADDGDGERQHHTQDNEKNGVVVGGGPVPETLLGLGVETM